MFNAKHCQHRTCMFKTFLNSYCFLKVNNVKISFPNDKHAFLLFLIHFKYSFRGSFIESEQNMGSLAC